MPKRIQAQRRMEAPIKCASNPVSGNPVNRAHPVNIWLLPILEGGRLNLFRDCICHTTSSSDFSSTIEGDPMAETRIAPRHRVVKPAKIEYGGYKIACTVRDISITGAALEVSDQREIPTTFTLIMPDDQLRLPCHVVWRRDYRIGVAF